MNTSLKDILSNKKFCYGAVAFFLVMLLQTYYFNNEFIEKSLPVSNLWFIFAVGAVFAIVSLALFQFRRISYYTYFLISLLFLGAMYIYILPPLNAPDEYVHFINSFAYSNMLFGEPDLGTMTQINGFAEIDAIANGSVSSLTLSEDIRKVAPQLLDLMDFFARFPPTMYFPSIAGITLGRMLNLDFIYILSAARICTFVCLAVSLYLAVRITPIGKAVYATLALIPLVINLATSCSYDSVTIAIAALLSAYCFKLIFQKQLITKKDLAILVVLTILLVPCKGVYSTIALLVLFIPKKNFRSRSQATLLKIGILLIAALIFLITKLPSLLCLVITPSATETLSVLGSETDTASLAISSSLNSSYSELRYYSNADFLKNPALIFEIIANTVYLDTSRIFWEQSGYVLGALNIISSHALIFGVCFTVLIILAYLVPNAKIIVSRRLRIACLTFWILTVVGLYGAMLFAWTPVGDIKIEGVQGRYFYPCAFLLIPIFLNCGFSAKEFNKYTLITLSVLVNILYVTNIYTCLATK